MASTAVDELKSLHTRAVDARHGYEEALEQAEGRGLTPLFQRMIGLHATNADELAASLRASGEIPDDSGSFMSTIHRTIMDIRSFFGGLDASVLPGLIDGEQRNLESYDEALRQPQLPSTVSNTLTQQRNRLQAALAEMRAMPH